MANKYPLVLSGSSIQELQTGDALATNFITTGASGAAGTIEGDWTLSTGSRLQASYADLAEKYLSDVEYDTGTVVVFGGDKEITVSNAVGDTRVAGVISEHPAYVMNATSNGQIVALRGKVPVKVFGLVKKGDLLTTSSIAGVATVATADTHPNAVFAKSLEEKHTPDVGTIIAVVI